MIFLDLAAFTSILVGMSCLILFAIFVFKNEHQVYACIFSFWLSAIMFHATTLGRYILTYEIILGPACLICFLFSTRYMATKYNLNHPLDKDSCLFLSGAGLWLGLQGGLLALILSSIVGLAFAASFLIDKKSKNPSSDAIKTMKQHTIPTGQSFAIGIALAALWKYSLF